MTIFPKIDFGSCYPHLFLVFLRPSFGACAPPSPNLAFILIIFSAKWEDFKPFRFKCQEKTSISRRAERLSITLSTSGKTSFLIFEFYVFFAEGLFDFVHILFKLRFLLRRIDGFQNFDIVIAHRFNNF